MKRNKKQIITKYKTRQLAHRFKWHYSKINCWIMQLFDMNSVQHSEYRMLNILHCVLKFKWKQHKMKSKHKNTRKKNTEIIRNSSTHRQVNISQYIRWQHLQAVDFVELTGFRFQVFHIANDALTVQQLRIVIWFGVHGVKNARFVYFVRIR